jgi:hypothetical protein
VRALPLSADAQPQPWQSCRLCAAAAAHAEPRAPLYRSAGRRPDFL